MKGLFYYVDLKEKFVGVLQFVLDLSERFYLLFYNVVCYLMSGVIDIILQVFCLFLEVEVVGKIVKFFRELRFEMENLVQFLVISFF